MSYKETGGSAKERKLAETSSAKRALTTAQMKKAFKDRNIEAGKFQTNLINAGKKLGIKTETAFKKLITKMLNTSESANKAVNKKLFNKGGKVKPKKMMGGKVAKKRMYGGSVKKFK